MNHSFVAAVWNNKICAGYIKDGVKIPCLQSESSHGDAVLCESCSNVGPVELVNKMLLCASCIAKERAVITEPKSEPEPPIEKLLERIDKLAESSTIKHIMDSAIAGNIKQYRDFFNADIPSIIQLREMIESDDSIAPDQKNYALAKALQRRITYLTMVLFTLRGSEIELTSEVKSIQFYVKDLIPQLRMKLRAEFAELTPNYTPQVIKTTAPKAARKNAQDKLAESYAKMMKIPFEQAQRLLANKLRDECTCSETPGMCKVHS